MSKPLLAQAPTTEADLLRGIDRINRTDSAQIAKADTAAASKKRAVDSPGPDVTEITSTREASFDAKARKAVFVGDVNVKSPEFELSADRLTVFLKEQSDQPGAGSGGLEKVIAEGKVEVTQTKIDPETGKPQLYVGKGQFFEYETATGDVTLRGWPQLSQGINVHVATEAATVMVLNRSGELTTSGGSKTLIQDTEKNQSQP